MPEGIHHNKLNTMAAMPDTLVSVVVATYNGEKYVGLQLDSIIQQTHRNIEVIVVDDCSTDNTYSVLKKYAEDYPNIKIFANETNAGYVKNFEKGMLLAKGNYIALSDQDDIWELDKIAILLREIGDHEIIYSNSALIDSEGNSLHKTTSDVRRQFGYSDCLMYAIGAWAPGHAMLITRDLVNRCLPFPNIVTHDFWLGFIATTKGPLKFISKPLVNYRQHDSNVFGSVKVKGRKKKKYTTQQEQDMLRERMKLLYDRCPDNLTEQKQAFFNLYKGYQSFSLSNDWLRMITFFKHRDKILAYKNKSAIGKCLFCLKTFVKLV